MNAYIDLLNDAVDAADTVEDRVSRSSLARPPAEGDGLGRLVRHPRLPHQTAGQFTDTAGREGCFNELGHNVAITPCPRECLEYLLMEQS